MKAVVVRKKSRLKRTLYVVRTAAEKNVARRKYPNYIVHDRTALSIMCRVERIIMTFTPRGEAEKQWFETTIKTRLKPGGHIEWRV